MNIEKLGTMRAAIEGDVKDLTAGIALAKRDIRSFGKGVPGWVAPVGAGMVAAGAVVTGALTKMIFDAGKFGDSLDKMSLRTGVAVEALSELSYAVKISGSDVNALETSFRFLARRMDESRQGIGIAEEAFGRLGVSVQDADGNMRDSVEVMAEVADGIVGLTSESERVAVAMDIFGARSGPQLLPLLKQGSAGIEELRKKAQELGLTMSGEAALAAAEFEDRLTDVRESAKMASFELGSVFLPVVSDVIGEVTRAVGWFSRLSDSQQRLVGWTTAAAGGFLAVSGAGLLIVGMIPKLVAGFATLKIVAIGSGFALAGAVAAAFASSLWAIHRVLEALKDPTGNLRGQIEGITETNEAAYRIVNVLKKRLQELTDDGFDPLTLTMGEAIVSLTRLGNDLGLVISPTFKVADMIEILENKLSRSSEEAATLRNKMRGLGEEEDKAKSATDEMSGALDELNKKTKEAVTEWDALSKAFSDYTAITGMGYDLNTLEAIKYYETVKQKGLETTEAETGVMNTIRNLWRDWFSEASFLEASHTSLVGMESQKRAVIDAEFMDRRTANRQEQISEDGKALAKGTEMIKGGLELQWMNQKFYSARIDKVLKDALRERLAREEDESEKSALHIQLRAIEMEEEEYKRILEIQNKAHTAGVKLAEKDAKERGRISKQAALDWQRNWEKATFEVKGATADLFDSMIDPTVLTQWDRFWDDLVSIARRKLAMLAADKVFGWLANLVSPGTATGGGTGAAGIARDVGIAKGAGALWDKIFPVAGTAATGAVVGAEGPMPLAEAGGSLAATAGWLGPLAIGAYSLYAQNQQEKQRWREQRTELESRLQFLNASDAYIRESLQRLTAFQNEEWSYFDFEEKKRGSRPTLARRQSTASGEFYVDEQGYKIRMAPGGVRIDKIEVILQNTQRMSAKEIEDEVSKRVVPAIRSAVNRGILNRSVLS